MTTPRQPSTESPTRRAVRPKPGALVLTACRSCGQHVRWTKDPDAVVRNPDNTPHQCGAVAPQRAPPATAGARIRPIEGFVCSGESAAVLLSLRAWLKDHEQVWKGHVITVEVRYPARTQSQKNQEEQSR